MFPTTTLNVNKDFIGKGDACEQLFNSSSRSSTGRTYSPDYFPASREEPGMKVVFRLAFNVNRHGNMINSANRKKNLM